MANETYIYSTGPNYIYIRISSVGAGPLRSVSSLGGTILYLGTAEEKPEEDLNPQYLPIFNNIAGKMVPFEQSYQGQVGTFAVVLNKFRHTVLSFLKTLPYHSRRPSESPGKEDYLSRGSLLQGNGASFELWRANGFYGTLNANAYPDLPPGRYYPCCKINRIFEANEGLADEKVLLLIEPQNAWNVVDGSFTLYSEAPANFVGLPEPK